MLTTPTARDLYRWARMCITEAEKTIDPAQQDRLLRMRDALVDIARDQTRQSMRRIETQTDAEILALAERMTGCRA